MPFPNKKVEKLLTRAMHPSSTANEAHMAAVAAGKILEEEGIDIREINITTGATAASSQQQKPSMEFAREILDENRSLRDQLDTLRREIKYVSYLKKQQEFKEEQRAYADRRQIETLRVRIEQLQSQLKKQVRGKRKRYLFEDPSDGHEEFITFTAFRSYVTNDIGVKFCKSAIARALEIPINLLNCWEKVGYFPFDLFVKLRSFDIEAFRPMQNKRWAPEEVEKLRIALDFSNNDDLHAAILLSGMLGRTVSEAAVASRRRKLKQRIMSDIEAP